MKTLVKHVTRAAIIANRNDLVVTSWSPRKAMDLYVGVIHFFDFPCLTYEKIRRCEKMSWKTYFNVWWIGRENSLESNDGSVSWWNVLYRQKKIFITILLNFNAFTINLQKQFIECLGKTQGTGKNDALPSPLNHLQSSCPAGTLCPPTIVLCIGP